MSAAKRLLWEDIAHSGFGRKQRADYEQAFIVNLYAMLGVLSLGIFGFEHVLADPTSVLGIAELIGAGTLAVSFVVLRLTKNIILASAWLLCTVIAILVVMLVTGGIASTGIFWFFIFPPVAFLLTNKSQGLIWMFILSAVVLTLLILAEMKLIHLAYSALTIRQLMIVLLMLTIGIYGYQSSRQRLQAQSVQSKNELEAEKIQAITVLEYIDEGVVVVDAEGKVTLINQAAQDMLGWSLADLKDKRFVDTVPLINKAGESIALDNVPDSETLKLPGDAADGAFYQRRDGTTFPVALEGRAIMVEGRVVGGVTAFRDITEEQAVDRTKTEFVTLASHQLRTPLSAIAWYGEMLLSGDVGKLTDDQRDYVLQMYRSNQRSIEMVDAMLKASSLELGNILTKPVPLDIAKLTHATLTEQRKAVAGEKRLIITEKYGKMLKPVVYDQAIVKTILQNLISNALKYTPDGGSLSLSVRTTDEAVRQSSKGSLCIEISDNGYGIPTRQHDKVFSRLFRADNIKKKDTNGTGLGLYIVKMAVRLIGGKLRFTSIEDQGSTFIVLLPLEGMKGKKGSHVATR